MLHKMDERNPKFISKIYKREQEQSMKNEEKKIL